jgi:hypothetical protein
MQPFDFLFSTRFLIGFVLAATLSGVRPSAGAAPEPGIGKTPRRIAVRTQAVDAPAGKTWLCQVGLPFQVSETHAALFCNLREALAQGVDFEVGNDVIVFSDVAEIGSAAPVVANRNHAEPNPKTVPGGRPAVMVKYPIRGGFAPLGAKRGDGTPHPHAGTGFGFSLAQAWQPLGDGPPPYHQNSYSGAEAYGYLELQQYAFDGRTFRVVGTERILPSELVEGWQFSNGGMTNAVADGDDLLVPMVGKSPFDAPGKRFNGATIVRMRHTGGRWKAVACEPIGPLGQTIEPSLVRDRDGRLLATARGSGELRHDVRIAGSADGGRTWATLVEKKGLIGAGPVTLNCAADGTPYVAANLLTVTPGPRDPLTLAAQARNRTVDSNQNNRNTLSIWPLVAGRDKPADDAAADHVLAAEIEVLDCRAKFGSPAGSNWTWRADHPSGMTVRLADGEWHHLLGFRVQDYREIKEAMPPTSRTGMYVYEVLSTGPALPVWNF